MRESGQWTWGLAVNRNHLRGDMKAGWILVDSEVRTQAKPVETCWHDGVLGIQCRWQIKCHNAAGNQPLGVIVNNPLCRQWLPVVAD